MVEGSTTIPLWALPPRPGAAVTSMCFHNHVAAAAGGGSASSAPNLVLGRSDGSFEVWGSGLWCCSIKGARIICELFAPDVTKKQVYDCSDGSTPRRIFHKELGQTLHCLQVGRM
jgi:hypothetical protein